MSHGSSGIEVGSTPLLRLEPMNLVLVGPPGSGKSAVGRLLAERHGREFIDTDQIVERESGKLIAQIIKHDGEAEFRRLEGEACRQVAEPANRVIATGGGALLDPTNRMYLEAGGTLVCLTASPEALLGRLGGDGSRPLVKGDDPAGRLRELLASRRPIYDAIPAQIDSTDLTTAQVALRIDDLALSSPDLHLTAHRPRPGYEVIVGQNLLSDLSSHLERADLAPPYFLVADSNVAPLYGERVQVALECPLLTIPAGEEHKSPDTLAEVYAALVGARMERGGSVLALGGGVTLDLAGYAAATYMRGLRWVALPTTLLAMVDASLGGKVGINLREGKNLVGAFHAPALVVADLRSLSTLPAAEIRTGLAEMVKAAFIEDADLFTSMEAGPAWVTRNWIRRAMEVKLAIVDRDPREAGGRAALNLGHTFGHALEAASDYALPHGEAVSVGLLASARIASALGRCEPELPERIERLLARFGLPTRHIGLRTDRILSAMAADKKVSAGRARFVLPARPGMVEVGVEVADALVREVLEELAEGA